MLPVRRQVPLAGLYTSALATPFPSPLCPPTTSTVQSRSNVAVWLERAVARLPVVRQVPGAAEVIVLTADGWGCAVTIDDVGKRLGLVVTDVFAPLKTG